MTSFVWGGLALKLLGAPLLILAASLAGRRWGEAIGGWLVGLPLTSGPAIFLLALDQGTDFAARSATGSVGGVIAQAAFCLGYAWVADVAGIGGGLLAGTASFALAGWALQTAALPLLPVFALAAVLLTVAVRVFPRRITPVQQGRMSRNDLPLRMVVAALVVLGITAAAPTLGPRLSGLLTTFPIMASILSLFAHRAYGPGAARRVLFGLLLGIYAFGTFFFVLGLSIRPLGIPAAFALAIAAALLVQGGSLLAMRWRSRIAAAR